MTRWCFDEIRGDFLPIQGFWRGKGRRNLGAWRWILPIEIVLASMGRRILIRMNKSGKD